MFTFTNSQILGLMRPVQVNQAFTVNASGQLVLGSYSTDYLPQASKVDAAVSKTTPSGGAGVTFWVAHWASYPWWTGDHLAGYLHTHAGSGVPVWPNYNYIVQPFPTPALVRNPVEIAANKDQDNAYLFYLK
jgi:hypothetical protein